MSDIVWESASASSQVEPPPWESPQWQEAVSQNPGLAPFFDNLESFVELPEGVEKLREMILDLAVRGQLVAQDKDDESASDLHKKLVAQKAALVANGEIKKTRKTLPAVDETETPSNLPFNWKWIRLGSVTDIFTGKLDANASSPNGEYPFFTCARDPLRIDKYAYDLECVLLAGNGNFDVNYYHGKFEAYQRTYVIAPIDRELMCVPFLYRFIQTYSDKLKLMSIGGVISYIKIGFLTEAYFPLPPLAEQRRIVSKVEGLMSLCDTLESQRRARESVRERASRSVLASLTSAPVHPPALADPEPESERQGASRRYSTGEVDSQEPTASALSLTKESASAYATSGKPGAEQVAKVANGETLQSSWQRLSDHFEVLLDQPETLAHLRQSILQLAVHGRLVPQAPTDEPACELIERIKQEKAELIAAKKLKKSNSHTQRDRGTQDWELPDGWAWTVVDDLTSVGTGTTPPKGNHDYYKDGTVPWITSAATNNEFIEEPSGYVTQLAVEERNMRMYPEGSLVVALYGQGKTRGQVGQLMFDSTSNQANAVMEFFGTGWDCRDYFRLVFQKKYHELRELAAGGAQPNLSGGLIRLTMIPLPPKAEQKRIVSKVSVLLSQLDELSARLRSRQSTTDALLTALIHSLLNGATRNE